jgi:formylglycine-generating enzyme required for sulfatase activity/WD40 repeat protein
MKDDQAPSTNRSAGAILFGLIAAMIVATAVVLVLRRSPGGASGLGTNASATNDVLKPVSGGELVLVPPGEFRMGQEGGRADEAPHDVSLASFCIDRNLVTQEFYERVMGVNPSKRKGKENPVERVQWTDAAKFCNKCSELDGLAPCYDPATWECRFDADGYRLPTEAEWEYACRAGTRTRYFFGDDAADARQYAWFKGDSEGRAHPVGGKLANAWGLNDMLGNVWEWCNDWYDDGYYGQSPRDNPRGPAAGKQRVLRGGAWDCDMDTCTGACRSKEFPVFSDACFGADTCGFRRVRSPVSQSPAGPKLAERLPRPPQKPAAPPAATVVRRGSPGPATASPAGELNISQIKGTVIFVSDRGGTLNIFSMRADGSGQKPLTSGNEPHADPRFSPDGKNILYTVLHGGFPEVWLMDRDGGGQRKVTPGCQADWSPDGRQIAFIRDNRVWIREISSGRERRVTPETWQRCGVPDWSPDGKRLAVASRHTGAIGIYLVSIDGKENAPLATEEESCTPCWSPDGRRLLCQTVKGHVHQLGADGRNWEQVTGGADVQHDARYSPDGSKIVFCRAPSADGPWQICVSRLGDDEMDFLPLTTEGSNSQPDWK